MCVAEITNYNTDWRIWLDTFQSAAQLTWRQDVENVSLHGGDCGDLNFPTGYAEPMQELFAPPRLSCMDDLAREDYEAWECLEAERAGEECTWPTSSAKIPNIHVAVEAAAYAMYKRHRGGGCGDNDDFSAFDV
jgi:hypothetical protein